MITSLYPAFTVLLAILVLRERVHRAQAVGLALCALTIVCVSAASAVHRRGRWRRRSPRTGTCSKVTRMALLIDDHARVRTLTLDRPDALNAFNEALYDATTEALVEAAEDPARRGGPAHRQRPRVQCRDRPARDAPDGHRSRRSSAASTGSSAWSTHWPPSPSRWSARSTASASGIGATVLGFADLAFMSRTARLKCPFTSLGVAPEAASSYLLPRLMGRQNAAWMLLSAEWIGAAEAAGDGTGLEGLRARRPARRRLGGTPRPLPRDRSRASWRSRRP